LAGGGNGGGRLDAEGDRRHNVLTIGSGQKGIKTVKASAEEPGKRLGTAAAAKKEKGALGYKPIKRFRKLLIIYRKTNKKEWLSFMPDERTGIQIVTRGAVPGREMWT